MDVSGCKTVKLFFIEIWNVDNCFISSNFSISLEFITTLKRLFQTKRYEYSSVFLFQVIMKTFDNSNLVAINVNQINSLACVNRFKKREFQKNLHFSNSRSLIDSLSLQNQIEKRYYQDRTRIIILNTYLSGHEI